MLFKYFPEIKYDKHLTRDLTRHISFIEEIERNPYVYLPYTLSDGEKPEDVSFHYYGTVEYTPYLLMANRVVNPYTDWLMTEENLTRHVIKKYAIKSGQRGFDVLRWATDGTRFDNIVYFVNRDDDSRVMACDTYIDLFIPTAQQEAFYERPETVTYTGLVQDWIPVRYYDFEVMQNEDRRTVNVVDRELIGAVHKQFITMIRE